MKTLPFLPLAVQTVYQGELSVRRRVTATELPLIKTAARKAKIPARAVVVTSSDAPDELWLFSRTPIPYDGDPTDNRPPPAEDRVAPRQPSVPGVAP